MKIYFCQYGKVISLSRKDALKACEDALKGHYNLQGLPSSRVLKRLELAKYGGFFQNGKYVEVHHCLDWSGDEWKYLLQKLTTRGSACRL